MPVSFRPHAVSGDPFMDEIMPCLATRAEVWDGRWLVKRWKWFTAHTAEHLRQLKAEAAATVRRREAVRRFSRRTRCAGSA